MAKVRKTTSASASVPKKAKKSGAAIPDDSTMKRYKCRGTPGGFGVSATPPATVKKSEQLVTKAGTKLTEAMENSLADEAEAGYDPAKLVPRRPVGRPSLSEHTGPSRRRTFRVDPEMDDDLEKKARASNMPVSEFIRELLERALKNWTPSKR